jgi:putative transposase
MTGASMRAASGSDSPVRFLPATGVGPKLTGVLPILYLRGLSTGDFQAALPGLLGEDATGLSPTTITHSLSTRNTSAESGA